MHPFVCTRGASDEIWQIPGFKKRLLEAKRRWLYLQGEWAGAKAVSGDWTLKGGAQGAWREPVWEAVGEVALVQQALLQHDKELFLHRIHNAGHIGLSGIGDGGRERNRRGSGM